MDPEKFRLIFLWGRSVLGRAGCKRATGYATYSEVPDEEHVRIALALKEHIGPDYPIHNFRAMYEAGRKLWRIDRDALRRITGGCPVSTIRPDKWAEMLEKFNTRLLALSTAAQPIKNIVAEAIKGVESKKLIVADVEVGYTYERDGFKVSHFEIKQPKPHSGTLSVTPTTPGVLGIAYKEWK